MLIRPIVFATLGSWILLRAKTQTTPFFWLKPFEHPHFVTVAIGCFLAAVLSIIFRRHVQWSQAWSVCLALTWCAKTLSWIYGQVGQVTQWGWASLQLIGLEAFWTLWILGYLNLLRMKLRTPQELPLVMLLPVALTVALLGSAQGQALAWYPVFALGGFLGLGTSKIELWDETPWVEVVAELVEGLSLLTLAFGGIWTVVLLGWDLVLGQYSHAVFLVLSLPIALWFSAGLLWGLSTFVRHGKLRSMIGRAAYFLTYWPKFSG